ncbi:FtsK/SpoIIIE domain-containing protein [Nocardia sp. Root136]|uniref:FtsK/SpoIIIE domain-containing protein n=1 Tax=Nocardia sp. Root136 TaxID=1736458 RepID=UPI000B29F2EC|nr:FtsK/SpoIIIE domain-containing protein [Nocardia sp. Root136]
MGTTVVALSTILATGMMLWWRRLDGVSPAASVSAVESDPLSHVPAELRVAVMVMTDVRQLAYMWVAIGLGGPDSGWPNVLTMTRVPSGAIAEVQMLGGQKVSDWTNDDTRDQLAQYLGVPKVVVTQTDPGFLTLDLRCWDTLADPVVVHPNAFVATGVDLSAVPVGVREDGRDWLVRLLGTHILLAGATGSGKGSVLWSLVAGVGPAIKAGYVDVWVADPKGGMEFSRGEDLWTRFEWTAAGILGMLADAVAQMQERTAQLKAARIRKFTPSPDMPLVWVVIDEGAALSSFATRDEQEQFRQYTGLLQSQGRAVGYSVTAAVQDPSKETMPNRQLFNVRVGLRLEEVTQIRMVHGDSAKDKGARCDEIPADTPGVGYVAEDGKDGFVRVRAFMVTDDDIDTLVTAYGPEKPDYSPQADYTGFDPDYIPGEDDEQGMAA